MRSDEITLYRVKRSVSMRRSKAAGILATSICILALCAGVLGENIPESVSEAGSDKAGYSRFSCSVSWSGRVFTGFYEGEVKEGLQEGEGTFSGEGDKGSVEYKGDWEEGRFEGKGTLVESPANVGYSGTFSEGKRSGFMTVEYPDRNETATARYAKDVPFGAYMKYDSSGTCIENDRFYMGYSLTQMLAEPSKASYSELLAEPKEYMHSMIRDRYTILETSMGFFSGEKTIGNNSKTEYGLLVEDREGNQYIFFIKLLDENIGKAYAFPFPVGTEIELYGDYTGIGTYMTRDNTVLTLPQIKLVGADWEEYQKTDFNHLEMTAENLLKYSAEFYKKEISLEGRIVSMYQEKEGDTAIWLSAADDAGAEAQYLCMIPAEEEDISVVQLSVGSGIKVEGTMMDPEIRTEGETICFYPKVRVGKIMQ